MQDQAEKYYWYLKTGLLPDSFELVTCQFDSVHVGFLNELSYEVIDEYDLREVGHGTFEWLCDHYF